MNACEPFSQKVVPINTRSEEKIHQHKKDFTVHYGRLVQATERGWHFFSEPLIIQEIKLGLWWLHHTSCLILGGDHVKNIRNVSETIALTYVLTLDIQVQGIAYNQWWSVLSHITGNLQVIEESLFLDKIHVFITDP